MSLSSTESLEERLPRLTPEGLNCLTHLLGLLLSLLGTVVLLRAVLPGGNAWQIFGCGLYASTLVLVYAASTLSHTFQRPSWRNFFRTLDQMSIFLLIAGSYTPWGLTYFRDTTGMWLLAAIWTLAIAGALFKLLVKGHQNVAVLAYVLLGWMPTIAIKPILERVPLAGLAWLAFGGVLYTVGTFFLNRDDRVPYFHAIWHLLVIAASTAHFLGVLWYVVPAA